jgi:hypothetical protein
MAIATKGQFPVLGEWSGTRETLHAYCKVLGTIRAAYAPEQPRFAHISLRLYTAGLTTTPIPFPEDGMRTFALSLDMRNHYVLLSTSQGDVQQIRMSEGLTATQLGEALQSKLSALGLKAKINAKKYKSDEPREYALDQAESYFAALTHSGQVLETFRSEIREETDAVQLWPHHFDLSFVALGKKTVKEKEGEYPSQLTVGFSPADSSQPAEYFYFNPYPFDDSVTQQSLPAGASWHTASWKGALLPYSEIAGKEDGAEKLHGFLRRCYDVEKNLI